MKTLCCFHICILYIYIEREREREGESDKPLQISITGTPKIVFFSAENTMF